MEADGAAARSRLGKGPAADAGDRNRRRMPETGDRRPEPAPDAGSRYRIVMTCEKVGSGSH